MFDGMRNDILFNFETAMKGKNLQISKAVKVTYKANGSVSVSEN